MDHRRTYANDLIDAGRIGAEVGRTATLHLRPRNFDYHAYVIDAENLDRHHRSEDFTYLAHHRVKAHIATELRVLIPTYGPWYLLRDYRPESEASHARRAFA